MFKLFQTRELQSRQTFAEGSFPGRLSRSHFRELTVAPEAGLHRSHLRLRAYRAYVTPLAVCRAGIARLIRTRRMRTLREWGRKLRGRLGLSLPAAHWSPLTPEEVFLEGLFWEDWYRATYADVVASENALLHFVTIGDAQQRTPSPSFDPAWYAAQLPLDLEGAPGPLTHYIRRGRHQGRLPAPPRGEVEANSALPEFAFPGWQSEWPALDPYEVYFSGLFNADWYRTRNADVPEDEEPLDHYVRVGDAERRSPSPLFDAGWYADQFDGEMGGAPGPLTHYLRRGRGQGRLLVPANDLRTLMAESPIFDEDWYVSAYPEALARGWQPLSYFLTEGLKKDHDPGPLFETDWYQKRYPETSRARTSAIEHYLSKGVALGYWPNRAFDPAYDLSANPDVSAAHVEPLQHYLEAGIREGRRAGPSFDEAFYAKDNPDVDLTLGSAMAHYVRVGWRQGRPAVPPRGRRVSLPGRLVTFSFLIDDYAAAPGSLKRTVESLEHQQVGEWEAFIAGLGSVPADVSAAATGDAATRVHYVATRERNRSVRLRRLLDRAVNDYIIVLDAGDEPTDDALKEMISELRYDPVDILYSDEEQRTSEFRESSINLKPDWSPELLTSYNYIGRLAAVKRSIALAIDPFHADAGEAGEWDLVLKVGFTTGSVRRLPKLLCHRSPASDLDRPSPISRRSSDFRAALQRHWRSQGVEAVVSALSDGTFDATWEIQDPPLVSVIIPSRNKPELMRRVLSGLFKTTDYPNTELIIVDNASDDPEALAMMAELQDSGKARVVSFNRPFNYSAACNAGAEVAKGELLLFLNNDVEMIDPDWLSELVRFGMRPGVGVVGTQLLYPDGTLQHAGVAVGMHLCGLVFRGAALDHWGVFGSPNVARNWLAIMGACQMVRRDVFERVGGFDETYRLANSDVALCVRAWLAGYRTAYAPKARLIHHEGATRGRSNPSEDVVRTAQDFRSLGLLEDPYFHPSLNAALSVPALLGASDLDGRANLASDTARLMLERPQCSWLDPYDVGQLADAAGLTAEMITWRPQTGVSVDDIWSAARLIIDLVRTRPDLRHTFPLGISAGRGGGLHAWMAGEGRNQLGLTDAGVQHVGAAFDAGLGRKPLQVYQLSPELKQAAPLGLTPGGRRALLAPLFRRGVEAYGLRLEEIWWFCFEWAETPERGVVFSWLFNADWQRFHPAGLTPFGRDDFAGWLASAFGAQGAWMNPNGWPIPLSPATQLRMAYFANDYWRRQHPRAFDDCAATSAFIDWLQEQPNGERAALSGWDRAELERDLRVDSVNLLGHLAYPSGLRTSAEAVVDGLERNGWRVGKRDVAVSLATDDPTHSAFVCPEVSDISILHVQPEPFFRDIYRRADVSPRRAKTYRIAYWYWELEEVPNAWIKLAADVDELWTATRFVGDALKQKFDLPVREFLPGVQLSQFNQYGREHFGLGKEFIFLFIFHMTSIMERKNPLGVIRAFRQAFDASDDVSLVLKTSFGSSHPKQMRALTDAAAGANIRILDAVYSRDETLSLMQSADAYVSLHRSEGFGLTMAESMLLGKPVIATGYSGNLDFMTPTNSLLVDFDLTRAIEAAPPYVEGSTWADPSVDHAAQCMRRVFENRAYARELGRSGQKTLEALASPEISGKRMADRLAEIQATLRAARVTESGITQGSARQGTSVRT